MQALGQSMTAHASNIVVAGWLLLSPLVWRQHAGHVVLALIAGMSVMVSSVAALRGWRWGSFLNAGLGLWLLAGAFLVPGGALVTVINHAGSGLTIILFAAISALSTEVMT
jgi:hypothetical protein